MKTIKHRNIQISILENCENCREAINQMNEMFKQGKPFEIKLIPDINISKVITHYHIELIPIKP